MARWAIAFVGLAAAVLPLWATAAPPSPPARTARPAVEAAAPAATPPAAGGVAAAMGAAPAPPLQRLVMALREIGLTACAAQFQQAGGFLFGPDPAEFVVQPLGPDADRWPTVVTMETARPGPGGSRLTTLVVSPGPTCSGFYEQKVTWDQPCATVARLYFPTFPKTRPLYRAVEVSDASPALQLYLMAAGKGCVTVKKEMFH